MILGVDPGQSGALALLPPDGETVVQVFDMPGTNADACELVRTLQGLGVTALWLEDVGGTIPPRQSAPRAWKFGNHCGTLHGFALGIGLPVYFVTPQRWQNTLGRPRTGKDGSRELASKFWPDMTHLWKLKKHADRAEAALIARYGANYLTK